MPQAENERLTTRNGEIWRGYIQGRTQEALAAEHGVSQQRVAQIIRDVRKSIPEEDAAELRRVDLERLDAMLPNNLTLAMGGDKDGVKSVLAIMTRRAALLGLDAATKVEANVQTPNLDPDVVALVSSLKAARSTESDEQGEG